jgi:hypothetical protein
VAAQRSQPAPISPAQAHYVLSRLIGDRTVSKTVVAEYLRQMDSEISELEQRLAFLRSVSGGDGNGSARAASASSSVAAPVRRGPGRPPGSGKASEGGTKAKKRSRRRVSAEVKAEQ